MADIITEYNRTGRKMLMTDVSEITKSNIAQIVSKAYIEHQQNAIEEIYLTNYERGIQPILYREKPIRPDINNRIVENNAAKIVDLHVGYDFSNPITFVQRAKVEIDKPDDEDGNKDDMRIATLNKMMQEQSKARKDVRLAYDMFITGVGYMMVLPKRDDRKQFSPFEIMTLNPYTTFVVYSNDAYREPMVAVTYFTHEDGTIDLTAYSKDYTYQIKTLGSPLELSTYEVSNAFPSILHMIPIVEFSLNDRMGIFEKVIPIMDAINLINSDRINDIAQHVQSLLWLHNCDIDDEKKKNLVDGDGVIMTHSSGDTTKDAKIEYLSQTLDEQQIQTLVDYYQGQLQQITSTPSWQEASGGSTTGAMQLSNGWQCLELSAKTVEQMFNESEMRILEIALAIINTDGKTSDLVKGIDVSDIEIRFSRNKTYDMVSKANTLATLLNSGVDGRTAFTTVQLFTDPQQAWIDSKDVVQGMQNKLKEPTESKNPFAKAVTATDENGNGGANNEPHSKADESAQPSKVAMVDDK